jgi:hypothetical protein
MGSENPSVSRKATTMPKQSHKARPPKGRRAPKQRKTSNSRVVQFPEVRGLTVEKVVLSTDSDFPCVSIRFQDNTDLTVLIDPWLTFQVDYSRWKAGNQKMLKRWPVFRSDGI